MSKARQLADLLDASGDVVTGALNNVPNPIQAGTIAFFSVNITPTGWLKANGSIISRTSYPDLFAAIGTTYGAGDGSTTFQIPDCRGEFLRSFDDGRGIDFGRGIGSYQKGSITAFNMPTSEGLGGTFSVGSNDTLSTWQPVAGVDPAHDSYAGTVTHHHSASVTNSGTWWTANGWGAGVTRPRNLAFLACIKY